ncbi:MAG: EAL domain-containing protein [Actinomycetota bacterium]
MHSLRHESSLRSRAVRTAARWLFAVAPVGGTAVVLGSRTAILIAVLAMGVVHVLSTEAIRRDYHSARNGLREENALRYRAERLANEQAEVLELIASGASLASVQTAIGGRIAAQTDGRYTVGPTGLVQVDPDAEPLDDDVHAAIDRLLAVCRAREQITSALTFQASHDALTGLANRGTIIDRLSHAMKQRTAPDIAVLYMDLDRFKQVNDTLGHEIGDDLLIEVANRITSSVREGDTVGRIGGDEFVVILERISLEDARRVAARMSGAIAAPLEIKGLPIDVGASIGVAMPESGDRDPDKLLREADQAMYRAKQGGKDFVEADDQLREWSRERHDIELRLREAIGEDDLVLHYQPVVDGQTGEIRGVEALVRLMWNGRMLSPGLFLQVAEETGQIAGIDRQVLMKAAKQVVAWNREFDRDLELAVNVSGAHLGRSDVFSEVMEALEASGLKPENLVLEITESVLLNDPAAVAERLDLLRRIGVKVAVDDFGTGYSSLTYLQRLPVDILKIDRAFVSRLGLTPGDDAIVQTILDLADALDLDVISEGVETEQQWGALRDMGCPACQGYHFSKPLPADDLAAAWLTEAGDAELKAA